MQLKQLNATEYNSMQPNATQHNSMQLNTTQCNAMQLNATQSNSMQLNATQHNPMQLNATHCIPHNSWFIMILNETQKAQCNSYKSMQIDATCWGNWCNSCKRTKLFVVEEKPNLQNSFFKSFSEI